MRKFLLSIFIFCNYQILVPNIINESNAIKQYLNAEEFYLKGSLSSYNKSIENAYYLYPESKTLMIDCLETFIIDKQYIKAQEILEQSSNLFEFDKNLLFIQIEIYLINKNYSKATETLNKLIIIDNSSPTIYKSAKLFERYNIYKQALNQYILLMNKNDFRDKVTKKIIALGINQEIKDVVFDKLYSRNVKINQQQKSQILFELYLNYNQTDSTLHYYNQLDNQDLIDNKGRLFFAQQLSRNAYYKKSNQILSNIQLDKKDYKIIGMKIMIFNYLNLDQYVDAGIIINQLIKEFPYLEIGYQLKANMLFNKESFVESIYYIEKGLVFSPDSYDLLILIAKSYSKINKINISKEYYLKALMIEPSSIEARQSLAIIYNREEDYIQCDNIFFELINETNHDKDILNNFAFVISERSKPNVNKLNFALNLSWLSINEDPKNGAYLDTLGWIYFKLQKFKLAKKYIELANKYIKNDVILGHLEQINKIIHENDE